MVDKLWNDWQYAHPANFWSYGGGAVSKTPGFIPDPIFPTGAPPYMNVRTLLKNEPAPLTNPLAVLDANPDGRYFERLHHLRADGH